MEGMGSFWSRMRPCLGSVCSPLGAGKRYNRRQIQQNIAAHENLGNAEARGGLQRPCQS